MYACTFFILRHVEVTSTSVVYGMPTRLGLNWRRREPKETQRNAPSKTMLPYGQISIKQMPVCTLPFIALALTSILSSRAKIQLSVLFLAKMIASLLLLDHPFLAHTKVSSSQHLNTRTPPNRVPPLVERSWKPADGDVSGQDNKKRHPRPTSFPLSVSMRLIFFQHCTPEGVCPAIADSAAVDSASAACECDVGCVLSLRPSLSGIGPAPTNIHPIQTCIETASSISTSAHLQTRRPANLEPTNSLVDKLQWHTTTDGRPPPVR